MRVAAIVFGFMAVMISAGAWAAHPVAVNEVTWATPGHDESDSMPIGNGDLAANVWTERSGDLVLLVYGRRIQLLPAWPREWTADFKLHAPYRTTISGHVENGRITNLEVSPRPRRKDVVIAQ